MKDENVSQVTFEVIPEQVCGNPQMFIALLTDAYNGLGTGFEMRAIQLPAYFASTIGGAVFCDIALLHHLLITDEEALALAGSQVAEVHLSQENPDGLETPDPDAIWILFLTSQQVLTCSVEPVTFEAQIAGKLKELIPSIFVPNPQPEN